MQRRIPLLILMLLLSPVYLFSQQKITGKVTSPDDPLGIPGVNIIIKGTSQGTISDINGDYTLEVPNDTCTLLFSYMGFNPEETQINGRAIINMQLLPSLESLDEVVITALGIKRDEKALGYSVQKVKGEEVSRVKELDVVNALSGKVAGVNIIQADGAIGGGGSRIVIRGESSLAGNTDPLFIINGIPGDANDVAPDDIESISVLKGAAAAALYGSKAGAGVVMITSKSGKNIGGMQVEFNSNNTFQTPLVLPKYQNKYGMGESGDYRYYDGNGNGAFDDTHLNWGPAFDGQSRPQFTGNLPWNAFNDNVKDFYQTGHTFVNNFSVANSSEKGNYRFSYTNTNQKGIMPNNGLVKNNLGLNSNFVVNKYLTITSNINYNRTECDNNKQVDVRFYPRSIDISALKDYWVPGMEGYQQMNYRRSGNNPYFELYENPYSYIDNRLILNVSANLKLTESFSIMGKYGTNYTNNEYYDQHAYSTFAKYEKRDLKGYYKNGMNNFWDNSAEFLATYDKKLFDDFTLKISFGGNHFRKEFKKIEGSTYELTYLDIYNLNNRDGYLSVLDEISIQETNSLYSFLNLDYKGKIFLDITGREDWASTLHPDNNHFFYPSVVLSALVHELLQLPELISFWKVRGSLAQVGNSIPGPYYTAEHKFSFETYSNGLTHLEPSNINVNPYLLPEISTGLEFGTDIRLFQNRLGLDVTVYNTVTKNQILTTDKTITGGGQDKFTTNAGQITSKGIEATLNLVPIKNKDLIWEMQINWSLDRTYLDELIDSMPEINKTQQVNSFLAIEDRVGQRRGTFYGRAYVRAPNGERLYSLSGDTRLTENTQLGNYNPDWMASLNNTITYKSLSLSFLFDLRYGGLIFNEIERKLNMYGLSEATLLNNREGIVPDGMVEENGTYRKLTLEDLEKAGKIGGQSGQEYWATQMEEATPENVLVDDTYLKLREMRLAFEMPKDWIKVSFVKAVTIALVGRNLAVWSKVKHVDPETYGEASEKNDFGGTTKVPGYANSNMPSVRSYGFSLSCKF
ncbi:MAG: SusC/RagA family TonB-linked outer membrane protein [Salinivirgaceae bacterium]